MPEVIDLLSYDDKPKIMRENRTRRRPLIAQTLLMASKATVIDLDTYDPPQRSSSRDQSFRTSASIPNDYRQLNTATMNPGTSNKSLPSVLRNQSPFKRPRSIISDNSSPEDPWNSNEPRVIASQSTNHGPGVQEGKVFSSLSRKSSTKPRGSRPVGESFSPFFEEPSGHVVSTPKPISVPRNLSLNLRREADPVHPRLQSSTEFHANEVNDNPGIRFSSGTSSIGAPSYSNNIRAHHIFNRKAGNFRQPTGRAALQHIDGEDSENDNAARSLRNSINVVTALHAHHLEEAQSSETEAIQDAASAQLLNGVAEELVNANSGPSGPAGSLIAFSQRESPPNQTTATPRPKLGGTDLVGGNLNTNLQEEKVTSESIESSQPVTNLPNESSISYEPSVPASMVFFPKEPVRVELEDIMEVFQKHINDLWSDQEYLMTPILRQAKLNCLNAPQPELSYDLPDPFASLEGTALSASFKPSSHPKVQDQIQLQLRISNNSYTQHTEGTINVQVIDYESKISTLPSYKSIVRLGPNILAKNDRTLKYLPYFNSEEGPKGRNESLYDELEKRYVDRVKTLPAQRKCAEMAEFWREYVECFLKEIELDFLDIIYFLLHDQDEKFDPDMELSSTALAAWMGREDECPACETVISQRAWADLWRQWKTLQLPEPNGRKLALAGLVCRIFIDIAKFSIWHIASTTPEAESLIRRVRRRKPNDAKKPYVLCLICHLHNCPTHGAYLEHGSDSSSESAYEESENDGDLGHNIRQHIALSNRPRFLTNITDVAFSVSHRSSTVGISLVFILRVS